MQGWKDKGTNGNNRSDIIMEQYVITEGYYIDDDHSICKYLYDNFIYTVMSASTHKGGDKMNYSVNITDEDALFIKLAFPEVTISKFISGA